MTAVIPVVSRLSSTPQPFPSLHFERSLLFIMKLRVGLIGLGATWENCYRPALHALADRFEVRAVCSEVSARTEQVAQEFNAVALGGFQVLTRRPDIDAVLLLAPGWYGSLPIYATCTAGKGLFCATDLHAEPNQSQEVRRRIEQSGIAFMSELPRRQAPATLRLKELIATKLGDPELVFCQLRQTRNALGETSGQHAHPTSMFRDLVELVDWCCYVVDQRPSSVTGLRHEVSTNPNDRDYRLVNLDFSPHHQPGTGPAAQISCGRYLSATWRDALSFRRPAELQVCCAHGVAFVDFPNTLTWFDDAGQHLESLDTDRVVGEQMLIQFHRSVTSLVRKTDAFENTFRSLDIVEASEESFRTGQRVMLNS